MNLPNRNGVVSIRFQYKVICLVLFLVIVMMKIMSFTCQDLTGTINNNGVSKTVFSIPIDDLYPCGGRPNCYYQINSKNCTKMTKLSVPLKLASVSGLKPPPLIATLSAGMKKNRREFFKDLYTAMDQNKPLELIFCDKRMDMLQWAKTSVEANTSLPPTLTMNFTIVYADSKRVQQIKTAAIEFSSIFVLIFNELPECVLVDDFNHKVFWSDSNRGTVEAYDTKTNNINILANFLQIRGSMVIDSTLGLLFWCNVDTMGRGSIERMDFEGGNRVEITKGKYDLAYPETLGIDLINRMIYWTDYKVIHTFDYNGENHKIMAKSDFYDPHFPGCFSFDADAAEHNFFWENRQLRHFDRSFMPNHLVSISYSKNDERVYKNMKLSSVFQERHNSELLEKRIVNVTCPAWIPKTNHCFLLPIPLSTSSCILDNRTMSMTGFKLEEQHNTSQFLEHDKLQVEIKWYINSNTRTVLYYDPKSRYIRFLFYVVQDRNRTVVYKYKSKYLFSYKFGIIGVHTSDIIILDPNEKLFCLLNSTDDSTKHLYFDGMYGRRYLSPNVFTYVTQVMDYNNNAHPHVVAVQKYVISKVLNITIKSLL